MEAIDWGDKFNVSEIDLGQSDKGQKTLTYRLWYGEEAHVKLWYDPTTFRLFKRTIEMGNDPKVLMTETFRDFTLDADLPDESFKITDEKKK